MHFDIKNVILGQKLSIWEGCFPRLVRSDLPRMESFGVDRKSVKGGREKSGKHFLCVKNYLGKAKKFQNDILSHLKVRNFQNFSGQI